MALKRNPCFTAMEHNTKKHTPPSERMRSDNEAVEIIFNLQAKVDHLEAENARLRDIEEKARAFVRDFDRYEVKLLFPRWANSQTLDAVFERLGNLKAALAEEE